MENGPIDSQQQSQSYMITTGEKGGEKSFET